MSGPDDAHQATINALAIEAGMQSIDESIAEIFGMTTKAAQGHAESEPERSP